MAPSTPRENRGSSPAGSGHSDDLGATQGNAAPGRIRNEITCGCSFCLHNGIMSVKKSAYYDTHKRYREEDAARAAQAAARRVAAAAAAAQDEQDRTPSPPPADHADVDIERTFIASSPIGGGGAPPSPALDPAPASPIPPGLSLPDPHIRSNTAPMSPVSDTNSSSSSLRARIQEERARQKQTARDKRIRDDGLDEDSYEFRIVRHLLPDMLVGITVPPPSDEPADRDIPFGDVPPPEPELVLPNPLLGDQPGQPAPAPAPVENDEGSPEVLPDLTAAYEIEPEPTLVELKVHRDFTKFLAGARLKDCKLPEHVIKQLLEPLQGTPELTEPGVRFSLDLFLKQTNASEATYTGVRSAILREHPDDVILTYKQVLAKITEITGIVTMAEDMCVNSCIAYTGPFAQLESCPYSDCLEPRYDQAVLAATKDRRGGPIKRPRRQFHTIPIGPQAQVIMRSPTRCSGLRYLGEKMKKVDAEAKENHGHLQVYDDWCCGLDIRNAYNFDGSRPGLDEPHRFCAHDLVLLLSLDGAQLYMLKQSDCWIYIWVILNYDPVVRYKRTHILIGGVFPGPHKPKNVDSFLFPGLHHIVACQNDGLMVWNSLTEQIESLNLFVAFETADTPGAVYLSGAAGHMSVHPCRILCNMQGRRKPDGKTYYPVHLTPDGYDLDGNTDNVDVRFLTHPTLQAYRRRVNFVLGSRTHADFERRRKITGITKPSLFSALRRGLGIPTSLTSDIMHLGSLNIPDLHMGLWMATIDCEKTDRLALWDFAVLRDTTQFEALGRRMGACKAFIPNSFHAAPRNIAEKLNSSYKAKEFQTFFYGYAPAMLMDLLPAVYHDNLCRLVDGMRIAHNRRVSLPDLLHAAQQLVIFVEQFEREYCKGRIDRMHFCRPSIHAIAHIIPEILRVGPGGILSQWTLERVIGLLVGSLRQHSAPYAHISQHALVWCQENAVRAFFPELDDDPEYVPSKLAVALRGGYYLLHKHEERASRITSPELQALWAYAYTMGWTDEEDPPETGVKVKRSARLRLPNGQFARSAWTECNKPLEKIRMSRNVKLTVGGIVTYGEVRYYFNFTREGAGPNGEDVTHILAMVALFSQPDRDILHKTHRVVYLCNYLGEEGLAVVDYTALHAVVAAIPLDPFARVPGDGPRWTTELASFRGPFFILEKMGLELDILAHAREREEEGDGAGA